MQKTENLFPEKEQKITSKEEMDKAIQEVESEEQLYSIALFDILGFSNLVENNGTKKVLDLYNKLVELIHNIESTFDGGVPFSGAVAPVPVSQDWKNNQLIADANGFIRVCHFSDTFVVYVNYIFNKPAWWLRDSFYEEYPLLAMEIGTQYCSLFWQKHHIYISFLQICTEFFCEAIKRGIPLRGCISTGMATMDAGKSIFFGRPLVEAARGEPAQDCVGVSFGRSFNNYHPAYNRYFIPYMEHMKKNDKRTAYLSPMVLDWPRFWREHRDFSKVSIPECIRKMNTNSAFSSYYDGAIKFAEFSEKYTDWPGNIDREGMRGIIDYYDRVKAWYQSSSK